MRVIVVDDDPAVRAALQRLLTRAGFDVVAAGHDGEHGLQLARTLRPDVVVMDLKMPKMTGTEVARLLRDSNPEIRVVIHTAYDEPAFETVAVNAGVTDYIVKGGGAGALIDVLRRFEQQLPMTDADPATS
jgi:two-component system, NarL family, invasion response regulator UvrY